jgi:hypothetical protein
LGAAARHLAHDGASRKRKFDEFLASRSPAEIRVPPFFAVFFSEPRLACATLGAVAAQVDRDPVDMLDLAFDVIALRSLEIIAKNWRKPTYSPELILTLTRPQ